MWKDIKKEKPEVGKEVLVWIDGHRGPSWSNNYALVAYLGENGEFYEERHPNSPALVRVKFWQEINKPE
jgi:hypothetical protein